MAAGIQLAIRIRAIGRVDHRLPRRARVCLWRRGFRRGRRRRGGGRRLAGECGAGKQEGGALHGGPFASSGGHRLAEVRPDRYNGVMFSVTQELAFCYGHRLLEYPGKCGRLHGHNGVARITLRSERLDRQGMVADFDAIERAMRAYLDESIDHRLLLHRADPLAATLRAADEPFVAVEFNPTAENIAKMIFEHARPAGFPVSEVELVEQEGSIAAYAP